MKKKNQKLYYVENVAEILIFQRRIKKRGWLDQKQ